MSDGMLAQARARSSEVVWRRGPAENLPFEDGALDAVVSTSAFHFFDQPGALREFHRVLAPGGLAAVATLSPRQPLPLHRLSASRLNPAHNPSPTEMRALFEGAGFGVSDQHASAVPLGRGCCRTWSPSASSPDWGTPALRDYAKPISGWFAHRLLRASPFRVWSAARQSTVRMPHSRAHHQHYRAGTDCASCACGRYHAGRTQKITIDGRQRQTTAALVRAAR